MDWPRQFIGERSPKILALLPKYGNVSDPDSSDDGVSEDELVGEDELVSEDELDSRVNSFFDVFDPEEIVCEDSESVVSEIDQIVGVPDPVQEVVYEETTRNTELDQAVQLPSTSVSPAKVTRTMARKSLSDNPPDKVIKKCQTKKPKKTAVPLEWKRADLKDGGITLPEPTRLEPEVQSSSHPVDYFYNFFTEELITSLVNQTKVYAFQKTGKPFNFNRDDCLDFIAVELIMGVVGMPAYRDYWSRQLRYDKVANVMSVNKYENIRRFFHMNNNEEFSGDPYHKVRPVLNYIRERCKEIDIGEKKFAIDEFIIPYKGKKAGHLRHYAPDEPCKWGFKFFVRSGSSGIVYDFIPYCGVETFSSINTNSGVTFTPQEDQFNMAEKCVVALTKSMVDTPLSAIYCDDYYSSPRLMLHLRKEYGILALGTFSLIRCSGAQHILLSDAELMKMGRGSMDSVADKSRKFILTKWVDNKVVLIGSTYVGVEPKCSVKRWSKEAREMVDIPAPRAVGEYNSFMGGDDLTDMLCSLYRTSLRTHKYYSALICWLIDISIINSWRLYLHEHPDSHMSSKEFRIKVANELLLYRRPKRGRPQ